MHERIRRWLSISPALAIVLAAGVCREARAQSTFGLSLHGKTSHPVPDVGGYYAYVNGDTTYHPGSKSTTVDFKVSGSRAGDALESFGFNSPVKGLVAGDFKLFAGPSKSDPSVKFKFRTNAYDGDFKHFSYYLDFDANKTRDVLVEFTVQGRHTLGDMLKGNEVNNMFVAYEKTPTSVGFVGGGTPFAAVPEPATFVMTATAGVIGLGFWRRRRIGAAA